MKPAKPRGSLRKCDKCGLFMEWHRVWRYYWCVRCKRREER